MSEEYKKKILDRISEIAIEHNHQRVELSQFSRDATKPRVKHTEYFKTQRNLKSPVLVEGWVDKNKKQETDHNASSLLRVVMAAVFIILCLVACFNPSKN